MSAYGAACIPNTQYVLLDIQDMHGGYSNRDDEAHFSSPCPWILSYDIFNLVQCFEGDLATAEFIPHFTLYVYCPSVMSLTVYTMGYEPYRAGSHKNLTHKRFHSLNISLQGEVRLAHLICADRLYNLKKAPHMIYDHSPETLLFMPE